MISKHYLIQIFLRVSLIMINCFVLAFVYYNSQKYVIITHLFLLVFLQSWLLGRYFNKTNKNIQYFLESLVNNDPVQLSSKKNGNKYHKKIYDQLEKLNSNVRTAEKELNKQLAYIQAVTTNIPGGLITVLDNGEVDFYSKSFMHIVDKRSVSSLNDFKDYPELYKVIKHLQPGDKRILKINAHNGLKVLSFSCAEIKSNNLKTRIITFEDIKVELDEKEIQSWQKLIRVLTHEMMNSFSPLMSTNETLGVLLKDAEFTKGKVIGVRELEKIKKIERGIDIINERSKGISHFIDNYRRLTKLPKPVCRQVSVYKLFEETVTLHKDLLRAKNISCNTEVEPKSLNIYADEQLIMQVLINLFKNAVEALGEAENPQINLKARLTNDNRSVITITDNGCGIEKEDIDEIFVPFFTTKKEGTGIGLSLSKQIIQKHKGDIYVNTKNWETEFVLIF